MLERGKELLVQIRSMRVQLFAVLVVIGLIPVIFFSNILINSYEKRLISQRTDEIQSYGTVLSNLVNSSEEPSMYIFEDFEKKLKQPQVHQNISIPNGVLAIISNDRHIQPYVLLFCGLTAVWRNHFRSEGRRVGREGRSWWWAYD